MYPRRLFLVVWRPPADVVIMGGYCECASCDGSKGVELAAIFVWSDGLPRRTRP